MFKHCLYNTALNKGVMCSIPSKYSLDSKLIISLLLSSKLKDLFITPNLALKNLCPKIDDDMAFAPIRNDIHSIHSFNFDAIKFADVIKRKVCIPNGVKFVEGELKQVKLDDFGLYFILYISHELYKVV